MPVDHACRDGGGKLWELEIRSDLRAIPVVHNPQALLQQLRRCQCLRNDFVEGGGPVKFRCERDTLAEAIATASERWRPGPVRCPSCPGSGCRPQTARVELVGLRPRADDPGRGTGPGRRRGQAVVPARLFADIVHQARGRRRDGRGRGRRRARSRRVGSGTRAHAVGRRLPPLARAAGAASRSTPAALAEALRQVIPAASQDDARPILTGVLLAATAGRPAPGRHRLVPARGARPPGRQHARAKARRCSSAAQGPERGAALLGDGEIEVMLAEREVGSASGRATSRRA